MRTMKEYYEKTFEEVGGVEEHARNSAMCMNGESRCINAVISRNGDLVLTDTIVNRDIADIKYDKIVWITDHRRVFYKTSNQDSDYMVYDTANDTIEFVSFDDKPCNTLILAPTKEILSVDGNKRRKFMTTNCVSDDILFVIDYFIDYSGMATCTHYVKCAETMLQNYADQRIEGAAKYITGNTKKNDRNLIDSAIIDITRMIPFLSKTKFYNDLRNMCIDGPVSIKTLHDDIMDKLYGWIIQNDESIYNMLKYSCDLSGFIKYSYFCKYDDNNMSRVATENFSTIKVGLELVHKYDNLDRTNIISMMSEYQDTILKFNRLEMSTDPSIELKQIALSNIIIYTGTIEFIYNRL